ncbi:MAG: TIR domain-containing protein, partial [Sphingobacteriales bacterium]
MNFEDQSKNISATQINTANLTNKTGFAFLSYSRHDRKRILEFASFLKREELPPWVDNQLKLGEIWDQQLENKIRDCNLLIG